MPRVDVRAAREKALQGRPIAQLKLEKNAILSLFIEDIWKLVRTYVSTNAFGIVEPRTSADIAAGGPSLLVPITAEALEHRCRAATRCALIVREIDECTKPVVFAAMRSWCETRLDRLEESTPGESQLLDDVLVRFLRVQDDLNRLRFGDGNADDIWMGMD